MRLFRGSDESKVGWDEATSKKMIDLINYYCGEGPLEALGAPKKTVRRIARLLPLNEEFYRRRQELGGIFTTVDELLGIPGMTPDRLERLAAATEGIDPGKLGMFAPQTTWNNKVEAYVNGAECLSVILEEINRAERYIHLTFMMFYNDKAGNAVTDALIRALNRGVQVRVMVDYGISGIGYGFKPGVGDFPKLAEKLQAAGGRTINTFNTCYKELDWDKKRKELQDRGVGEEVLYPQDLVQDFVISDLNVVNHRKMIVIDGVTAIIGSLNIGDQYIYETTAAGSDPAQPIEWRQGVPAEEEQWHDGCFRIRGAAALPLNRLFASQWVVLGGDIFDPVDSYFYPEINRYFGEEVCTVISCFPGNPVNPLRQYHLDLIRYAGDEAIIVNPYLIDQGFWDILKELDEPQSRRLTLCNPMHVNDHLTNHAAIQSNMYGPFHKGVSLYDYSKTGRFSHWKIAYDRKADSVFHGSYNLNTRSAIHDFEMGVLVRGKAFADKVRDMISYDLGQSEKITSAKAFYKHPWLHPKKYLNDVSKYFT